MKSCKILIMVLGFLGCIEGLQAMESWRYSSQPTFADSIVKAARSKSINVEEAMKQASIPTRESLTTQAKYRTSDTNKVVFNPDYQSAAKQEPVSAGWFSLGLNNLKNSFLGNFTSSDENNIDSENKSIQMQEPAQAPLLVTANSTFIQQPIQVQQEQSMQEPVQAPLLLTYDPTFKNQESMPEQPVVASSQLHQDLTTRLTAPVFNNSYGINPFNKMPQSIKMQEATQPELIQTQEPVKAPLLLLTWPEQPSNQNIPVAQVFNTPVQSEVDSQPALTQSEKVVSNPLVTRSVIQSGVRKLPTRQKQLHVDETQITYAPESVVLQEQETKIDTSLPTIDVVQAENSKPLLIQNINTSESAALPEVLEQKAEEEVKKLPINPTRQSFMSMLSDLKNWILNSIGYKFSLQKEQAIDTENQNALRDLQAQIISDGTVNKATMTERIRLFIQRLLDIVTKP